jgi:transposase InsO family protein
MEELLKQKYLDLENAGALTSVQTLYRATKQANPDTTLANVKHWLQTQDVYTLHKPARRAFKHRRVYVKGINDQFQIDLCDMRALSKQNDGYAYILTCIDVFSKYAWAIPLKCKKPGDAAQAFLKILSMGRKPMYVQSDEGKEFLGKNFQQMLKQQGIKHFTSRNPDIKCAVVERFNRTLKTRMWRAFTLQRSHRWLDILDRLVVAYNNSYHRSIRMKPSEVTKDNEAQVYNTLYGKDASSISSRQRFKFNLGDQVRLQKKNVPFRKGYEPQWTEEVFTVSKRLGKIPPIFYVKDYAGEEVRASYYAHELQKVIKDLAEPYWVEKILKTRRDKRGNIEYFVKWSGYPDSFNQWIPSKELKR